MIVGYTLGFTEGQNLDSEIHALLEMGAEHVFSDCLSGPVSARPELERMLDQLRPDDVVTVMRYAQLSRSLHDLLRIIERIRKKGAGFRSVAEDIDTSKPVGRRFFHVFSSIAQFEKERISERTREGLAAARKRGRVGGRPPALSPAQKADVLRMRDDERRPLPEIASLFNVSVKTVRRVK